MSDRSLDEFPGNYKSESLSTDQDKADIGPGKVKDDVERETVRDDVASPVAGEAKGGNDADRPVAVSGGDATTAPIQNKETEPVVKSTRQDVEAKPTHDRDKTEDRSTIGERKEDIVSGQTNTGQKVPVLAAWSQLDQAEDVEAAEITQRDTKVDSQLQTAPSDDDTLALDVLPSTDDIEVAKYNDRLKETLKLQQYTQTLMVVARYLYIATLALATDSEYLSKAQELLFTSLKLCDKTSLMLQSFQSGANNILEKLKVAYLYCMDGFEDFARTDIEATKKDVGTMRESVQKTKRLLSDFRSQITEVQKSVGDESVKLKRAGVVAPERGEAGGGRSPLGGSGPTGATASSGTDVDSDESAGEEDELIVKGEKRKLSKYADVERQSCTQGLVLPKYYPWVVLGLATLALITVVLHIVEDYDPIWPYKGDVYQPRVLIETISCLGLLFVFLGIFNACRRPFRLGIYLNLIVVISITLVFLQILDCRFLWWSRSKNNWITFPVAVLLLIIDLVCVKLLCQCGRSEAFPYNIGSITNARKRRNNEGTNHGTRKRAGQEANSEDDNPSKGDTDFDDIERKSMWLRYGRFKLTEAVLLEVASNLDVASGLLDGLVPVVEGWFKECVDVLEPAMEHGISETESMSSAEEKKGYWNSIVFKKEVTDYYCRWRALQVYSENTRPKLKTARQRIEQFYTENQYPRDAVVSAWKMAAEETVPEILHLVAQFNPTTCSVVYEQD